jgi:hypothetical protein
MKFLAASAVAAMLALAPLSARAIKVSLLLRRLKWPTPSFRKDVIAPSCEKKRPPSAACAVG